LISVLILAFSNVADLTACDDFLLTGFPTPVARSEVVHRISSWNGKSQIPVSENVWLEVIVLMMAGYRQTFDPRGVSLISNRGWSVYVDTFGDPDPSYTGTRSL
jgi:hypothetical protein